MDMPYFLRPSKAYWRHVYYFIGADRGPVLEVVVSRTNFISATTGHKVRVVGLSTALANARDLADWLGIKEVGQIKHVKVIYTFRCICTPQQTY